MHVNRLHILKRFHQYIHRAEGLEGSDDVEMFRRYREMLARAYEDFTVSDAVTEKVFKVFQDVQGESHVGMSGLRASLDDRRRARESGTSLSAAG